MQKKRNNRVRIPLLMQVILVQWEKKYFVASLPKDLPLILQLEMKTTIYYFTMWKILNLSLH